MAVDEGAVMGGGEDVKAAGDGLLLEACPDRKVKRPLCEPNRSVRAAF